MMTQSSSPFGSCWFQNSEEKRSPGEVEPERLDLPYRHPSKLTNSVSHSFWSLEGDGVNFMPNFENHNMLSYLKMCVYSSGTFGH